MADEINDDDFYDVVMLKTVLFAGRQLRPTQKHTVRGAVVKLLQKADADSVGAVTLLQK